MTSQIRSRARIWLAALPLLATLAAVWLGWALGGEQSLDVGAPADGPYVAGFFEPEAISGQTYRWGKTDPTVQLPAVRAPWLLVARIAGRPGGLSVSLRLDGQSLPPFDVAPLEIRRYRVLVGPATHAADLVTLVFGAQAERTPADGRRLAVLVESVTAEPLSGAPDIPPLPTLAALAALALAGWALLRLAGAGQVVSTLLAIALGAGLAVAWAMARLVVGPYLPGAALIVVAGAGLLGALRAGVRGGAADVAQLAGALAAAAGLAPLVLLLTGQQPWEAAALAQALLVPLGLALVVTRGAARTALGALALLAAAAGAALLLQPLLPEADVGTPFHALQRAAERLWFGTLPLYNTVTLDANPFANSFSGPPLLAALLLPLATLPYAQSLVAWRLLSIAMLLAAALLLLGAYRLPLRSWPAAGLGLLLLTLGPILVTLAEGRVAPLILLLLAGGLYALCRGRDTLLGVCLGAAAAVSPPALLLLGFVLAQRRWRALAGAAAAFALLGLASVLVAGWPVHAVYLAQVAPALAQSTPWPQNQSLQAFLSRLLVPDQLALRPSGAGPAQFAGWAAAAIVLALTAWLSWRRERPERGFALWLAALLLAAPLAWAPDHLLLILPLFVALAAGAPDERPLPWPALACLALGVALLAHGDPLALYDEVLRGPFWGLALSAPLAAALLVYASLALAARPDRRLTTGNRRPTADSV